MSELPEDAGKTQMLERIACLEGEVATLTARVDDLLAGFKYQVDATANQIIAIRNLLDPVVDKLFPHFAETLYQIEAIAPSNAADPQADKRIEKDMK